ncbi:MAG: hypothetical protein QOJ73_6691 [Streptosporangiaceae bacterium]|jgi:hypothetical protein|nr:hypothetical protein [Streptosporangiaceae bacterium]
MAHKNQMGRSALSVTPEARLGEAQILRFLPRAGHPGTGHPQPPGAWLRASTRLSPPRVART